MSEYRHIGKQTKRIIGDQIVTGKAKYTGDFKLPGMQYGKILRSPHPFAKILKIKKEQALALEGVTAIVTHEDIDKNIYVTNGFTPPKHYRIMSEYVRFIGDPVALVVAVNEDVANEACDLIEVKYEVLEPVFTIEEALAEGAPQLFAEFPRNIAPHKCNLNFEIGDPEKGFAESDVVVEAETALMSGQNPLPVEAPVMIADWEGDTVTIIASAAAPHYCHWQTAASLNIPHESVRLIVPAVGGSFGSKLYSGNVQILVLAALMSKAAHCPVYYSYSKEEHFTVHQTRMRTKAKIKFGMKKNGLANAIVMEQYSDAGCCASTQEFMMQVGIHTLAMLCRTNNVKYDGEVVVTNHLPSGSFRGYGYLESTNLLSGVIAEACEKLNVDPVDYLIKNAMRPGTEYYSAIAAPHFWQKNMIFDWSKLVQKTAQAFKWQERWKGWGIPVWESPDGRFVRGLGVAAAGHSDTGGKPANANVTLTGLNAVYVSTSMVDFGAGTREVMQKIAAEELDVPLESIRLTPSDTGTTPLDFGSTASRSTFTSGISVKRACVDLKKKLFERVEAKTGIPAGDCGFKDGVVYRLSNPEEKIELFPRLMAKVDSITGTGHFDGVENSTVFHLQMIEVEVDKEMGTFRITDHFSGSDAGVIVNPLETRNQMQSFFAGTDIACMEETVFDPNDFRVLNPSNIDYKVRTFNDVVPCDYIVLESNKGLETDYPFGANGVGEPLISPGGPAIRMAIYNACGVKLDSYPFTPDKLLAALQQKEGK